MDVDVGLDYITRYRGGLSHCQCECMSICLLLTSSHLLTSLIRTFLVIILSVCRSFFSQISCSLSFIHTFVRSFIRSRFLLFLFCAPFSKFLSPQRFCVCKIVWDPLVVYLFLFSFCVFIFYFFRFVSCRICKCKPNACVCVCIFI